MDVDIRFFQAAATVIPTLYIALAVSAKVFHTEARGMFSPASTKDVFYAAANIALIGSAETATLAIIAMNQPRITWAATIGIVIGLQLMMLGSAAILPGADAHAPEKGLRRIGFVVVVMGAILLPILVFGLMIGFYFRG